MTSAPTTPLSSCTSPALERISKLYLLEEVVESYLKEEVDYAAMLVRDIYRPRASGKVSSKLMWYSPEDITEIDSVESLRRIRQQFDCETMEPSTKTDMFFACSMYELITYRMEELQ